MDCALISRVLWVGAACRNLEARLEKVKVCSLFTICGSSVDQGQVRFTVHWQVHCDVIAPVYSTVTQLWRYGHSSRKPHPLRVACENSNQTLTGVWLRVAKHSNLVLANIIGGSKWKQCPKKKKSSHWAHWHCSDHLQYKCFRLNLYWLACSSLAGKYKGLGTLYFSNLILLGYYGWFPSAN